MPIPIGKLCHTLCYARNAFTIPVLLSHSWRRTKRVSCRPCFPSLACPSLRSMLVSSIHLKSAIVVDILKFVELSGEVSRASHKFGGVMVGGHRRGPVCRRELLLTCA